MDIEEPMDIDDNNMLEFLKNMQEKELVDDHINAYMDMLNKYQGKKPKIKYMDTFFMVGIELSEKKGEKKTKATKHLKKLLNEDGTIPERVFIPVHVLGNHWALLGICFYTRHVIISDSMDSITEVHGMKQSVYYAKMKAYFTMLMDCMQYAQVDLRHAWAFKSNYPWILVRAFQQTPQTDEVSCGFFVLLQAKTWLLADSVAELVVFNFAELVKLKLGVCLEITKRELDMEHGEVELVVFKGIEKTKSCRLNSKNPAASGMVKLECLMNHNYVSFKTSSGYFTRGLAFEDTLVEYLEFLDNVTERGRDVNISIEPLADSRDNLPDILKIMTVAFQCISGGKEKILSKELDVMRIFLLSDVVLECVEDGFNVVALEVDYANNGIEFGVEPKLKAKAIVIFHDALASMFHSFCRYSKRLDIYVADSKMDLEKNLRLMSDTGVKDFFRFIG